MPMVGKPLREIDHSDLLLLCKKNGREDKQFELKQDLPSKSGPDSWHTARTISAYARDKILAEVVAFANSYGGDVVIGIAETIRCPVVLSHAHNWRGIRESLDAVHSSAVG